MAILIVRNGDEISQQGTDEKEISAVPKRRRFRLTDARGVRRELAALYAELRNGEIKLHTAKAAGFLLRCLLESIRTDEIEHRLAELERKAR